MPIVPDVKDWTWVLSRPCPECGFDAAATAYEAVPALIRETAVRFAAVLDRPGMRARPDESTWSALEYGAHVRDVCRMSGTRLGLMLTDDSDGEPPRFPNWDQDAAAATDRYNEQEPAVVAGELAEAADRAALAFESVPPERRGLRGARSDGAEFTVESFARYILHDLLHHVHDVRG
ncbi:DinB family protein [Nocardia exalbida]|uniref:DinB family protein n=1 Tax=Nocardia exalbida TaxID=290231 RepID=UPI0002FF3A47|nr:DinB family protein [Nocardia exalbida]